MDALSRILLCAALLVSTGCATTPRQASDPPSLSHDSGFLSDYSHLQMVKSGSFRDVYVAPDAAAHAARYTSVMVDQPELFLHPNSKYKGLKPDDMKFIADALRTHVIDELKSGYAIVDEPGDNVLYVRLAVTDLMLQKKTRPVLAYVPVGAIIHGVKNLAREVPERIDIANMKVEGKVFDSVSMDLIASGISSRDDRSPVSGTKSTVSWDKLFDLFTVIGKRLRCRLDNPRLPEDMQHACGAIEHTAGSDQSEPRSRL